VFRQRGEEGGGRRGRGKDRGGRRRGPACLCAGECGVYWVLIISGTGNTYIHTQDIMKSTQLGSAHLCFADTHGLVGRAVVTHIVIVTIANPAVATSSTVTPQCLRLTQPLSIAVAAATAVAALRLLPRTSAVGGTFADSAWAAALAESAKVPPTADVLGSSRSAATAVAAATAIESV
jgi:hypothetical protein